MDVPPGIALGLPALELILDFSLSLDPVPSDISPPVASPSLPEPAPALLRRAMAAEPKGVPARMPEGSTLFFIFFFRDDSFPLDSDRFGEPARLRDFLFLMASPSLCFPCGVVLLLVKDFALSLSA